MLKHKYFTTARDFVDVLEVLIGSDNCNYSGTPDLTINIRKREAFATLI